jgi:hypothetical protein
MGEHVFEVVGALADADLAALHASSDASFFDIFGLVTVVWPAAINVAAALAALLGLIGLAVVHRDVWTPRAAVWAVLAFIAVPLLLFALGWLLSFPLGIWPGVHPLDHPQPWPGRVALAAAGILIPLIVAMIVNGRVDWRALLMVNWIGLSLTAIGVAITVGGAAYPFLWPVLGVAVVGWIETLTLKRRVHALSHAGWVGFVLAAFSFLAFFLALELVLSFALSQFKILVLVPFALALVPVFAASVQRSAHAAWVASVLCALVVAAAAPASRTPAYAENHPRGLNIVYYDDRAGTPRWLAGIVGKPDEEFLKGQGFPRQDEEYRNLGLQKAQGRFKPAIDQHLPAPSFAVKGVDAQGGLQVVRGVLRSGRGGFLVGIGIAPGSGVRSIRIDDQEAVGADRLKTSEPTFVQLWGLRSREVPMEVFFDAGAVPKLVLYERSRLPDSEEARTLAAARPLDAAPAYSGDSALVFIELDFKR